MPTLRRFLDAAGSIFRAAGTTSAAHAFESLEPRALLSDAAALPTGASWMDWGNTRAAVYQGQWIVTFDNSQTPQQMNALTSQLASRLHIRVSDVTPLGSLGYNATFSTGDAISFDSAQYALRNISGIKAVEPNRAFQTTALPNDPQFDQEWFLQNNGQPDNLGFLGTIGADISATQAWDVTIGSRSVIVAVIDTGVDIDHPDLAANIWRNPGEIAGDGVDNDGNGFIDDVSGWDFGNQDSDPREAAPGEGYQHGTGVAGVIGAVGNNNFGVTGVAWNVSILPLKIANGFALTTAAIVGAHDYATMMRQRGANIVASNNSYGGLNDTFYADAPEGFDAERDAIVRFVNSGGTFVAAAGNGGADGIGDDNDDPNVTEFPASYNIPGVIAVAATDHNDALTVFSNFGAQTVDVAAPGLAIRTTDNLGTYQWFAGTSAASPIVAGAVALLKTAKPTASAVEVREALIDGSDHLPGLEGKVRSGGRINVARSLQLISVDGPGIVAVNPGPVTGQLDASTNTPVNTVSVTFSKDIDPAFLSTGAVSLRGNGVDNTFGSGDDIIVPIASIARDAANPRIVNIGLNLTGFTLQRLPIDQYRLTLDDAGFRDTAGNYLYGNNAGGADGVYDFEVRATTGDNEPNDTLAQATPVVFNASGQAAYTGVTLGNGLFGNLDADLYKVTMARGGLITAETIAQRLPIPSTLDSYIRLFSATGQQLAANDQYNGNDSFIDFYVNTGGIYYIGVSGFGNNAYNPNTGGSGQTQSLGTYNLNLSIQLSQNDAVGYNSGDNSPPSQPPFPLPIPATAPPNGVDTSGVTTAQIIVTDTREILDVNIRLNLEHTFDGDLQVSLISPTGTEVLLINRRGGSGDNFGVPGGSPPSQNTILDDEASSLISAGVAPFVGSFRPDNPLSAFDGQSANGAWTLRIVDTTPLNYGQLNYWSIEFVFQNNVFGPYESNDTIATAKNVAEIVGSGTASRAAFIGDGGFGNLDRDLFKFTADVGTTLTAAATSGGALNIALRLFDFAGNEIGLSNPSNFLGATLSHVFAAGGTYYIAVSEGANIAFNPFAVNDGTGVPAVTTGTYTLNLTVAPGVSDSGTTLTGDSLRVGVGTDGDFGVSNGAGLGLEFNGIEFLDNNSSFYGAGFQGYAFVNGSSDQLPVALTSQGDAANNRLLVKGGFRGLSVQRSISFALSDNFVAIDVYLTNNSTSNITGLAWMEGFNPDPGVSFGEGSRFTNNDVDATRPIASARYVNNIYMQGFTIALAAAPNDARASAIVVPSTLSVRDPNQLDAIAQGGTLDPDGASADDSLALTYDLGNVAAGQTVSMRYFVLFGVNPAAADALYSQVENNTGSGHLTADPANPAQEALSTGGAPASAPTLPYRLYFPEGFYGPNIFTFIPITNPNDQATRVVVIARWETGARDQIVGDLNIPANSRSGLTLTTRETYENGTLLDGRPETPYSLEIRAERPVAATFSHYDLTLLSNPSAIGESFTSRSSTQWTFGQVTKGGGNTQFVIFYNTTAVTEKVTTFFYPTYGGTPFRVDFATPGLDGLEGFRRGGLAINDARTSAAYTMPSTYTLIADYTLTAAMRIPQSDGSTLVLAQGTNLPAGYVIPTGTILDLGSALFDGSYGVVVQSNVPIVASLSEYNNAAGTAEGVIGNNGAGSTTGVIPEGQIGLNGTSEKVGILNTTASTANITLSFLLSNGSAYRQAVTLAPRSSTSFDVASLPDFPTGTPYGLFYESNVAVSLNVFDPVFNDAVAASTADRAFTYWGFGEGFRPGDGSGHPGVLEYLRLYNPSADDATVEISISYDGVPGTDVFRYTLPGRRVTELNMDQFIVGSRRASNQWYGTFIKSASPIVAYFAHWDQSTGGGPRGAFGTLGTPLGNSAPVT